MKEIKDFNKNEKKIKKKKDETVEIIIDTIGDIVKLGLLIGVIILIHIYILKNPIDLTPNPDPVVETVVIKDLYHNDTGYYITVFNETNRIVYNIPITKEEFIQYKENDTVDIIVYTSVKATLDRRINVVENE